MSGQEGATGLSSPTTHPDAQALVIRPFRADDAPAFRALNEQWITRYFKLEPKDGATLANPQRSIIDRGGQILIATVAGHTVACCALLRIAPDEFEAAKMAVDPAYQGRGIGRRLFQAVIHEARRLHARRLYLETNSALKPAIHLYESLGFQRLDPVHVTPSPYDRVDIYMELKLNT